MIKVVLDSNVIISSLLSLGPPAAIIDIVADGKIIPFYNADIFREYIDVLSRKKFNFSSLQITHLINDITRTGIAIENLQPSKIKMIDEDDRKFYDTAVNAQAYLITGNLRHFPSKDFIVSPAQFITIYHR